jgi:hypothetical protein
VFDLVERALPALALRGQHAPTRASHQPHELGRVRVARLVQLESLQSLGQWMLHPRARVERARAFGAPKLDVAPESKGRIERREDRQGRDRDPAPTSDTDARDGGPRERDGERERRQEQAVPHRVDADERAGSDHHGDIGEREARTRYDDRSAIDPHEHDDRESARREADPTRPRRERFDREPRAQRVRGARSNFEKRLRRRSAAAGPLAFDEMVAQQPGCERQSARQRVCGRAQQATPDGQ